MWGHISAYRVGAIVGLSALAVMSSAAAQAATPVKPAAGPKPGTLETYRDWTIGCDNANRCTAVSLVPENREDSLPGSEVQLEIRRDAGPAGEISITADFTSDTLKGGVDFLVDGMRIISAPIARQQAVVRGPQASALALAIARGGKLEIRQGAKLIGRPSLAGSAAALRFMDARQARAGTTTALVATGALGPQAVKPAPALPVVRRLPVPMTGTVPPLSRDERARANKLSGCTTDDPGNAQVGYHVLAADRALVMLPCGAGAYNIIAAPLIATGVVGKRIFALAKFDYAPGWGGEGGTPMLVNAEWQAAKSRLSSYAKGRGPGDCGNAEDYVWDGAMFRLVEASAMGECRGAWNWITVWRAGVVP